MATEFQKGTRNNVPGEPDHPIGSICRSGSFLCYDKGMQLIDTHCHIHESTYPLDRETVIQSARTAGVTRLICVGTNEKSSKEAIEFASSHDDIYATIGVHPHDTKEGWQGLEALLGRQVDPIHSTDGFADASLKLDAAVDVFINEGAQPSSIVVGVGEIGLDYFYTHSPRETQIKALEEQINLALKYNLPIVFHVREAFDDFWPIFDNFSGIRGELHSFTDSKENLEEGLKRGLFIGVNGISTFTKNDSQKEMFAAIPLEKLVIETDAPFLTPMPFRGKVNEPAFAKNVADFHARVRGLSLEEIAAATTANANALFAL
jgi:TatD DNase family protein